MKRRSFVLLALTSLATAACGAPPPVPGAAGPAPAGGVGAALAAEGATVSLYWPANANFAAFIAEDLVPGFRAHVQRVHGVEIEVDVLDAAGGDGAFLDRLAANGDRPGFGIDVARTAPSDALLGALERGLLAPLDAAPDLVGNLGDVDPAGLATFTRDGSVFGAPIYRPTMSLFYNADLVPDPPRTLAELAAFAAANPGRVTYEDPRSSTGTGSGTMFLLAVQHAFGDVTDPATWEPGWRYLADLQPVLAPQPQAGDQMIDLFARGEITVMPYWNDAGLFAAEDLGIEGMRNLRLQEGFPIRYTPFVVPAGAAHPTAALLLTDYMLGPEMQTRLAERMRQIPSSTAPEVVDVIDDETFGFPVAEITATSFPAYDSPAALAAVSALNADFERRVLGR